MVTSHFDVIIIGAGAAGLMCASESIKRKRRTLIIEKSAKPGRKILMSGGGRCNFTNLHIKPEAYISNNPHFVKSALSRYTQWDFISKVKHHGIAFHEKTQGQLFCDLSSKLIVTMLLKEIEGCELQTKTTVQHIRHDSKSGGLTIKTNHAVYTCESLVIATGGLSIPSMGTTPFAYETAKEFNIGVTNIRAGLVPFTLHPKDKELTEAMSGVSEACSASCERTEFKDDMLFTHRGLSGPAMLQLSSYWQPGDSIQLDFSQGEDLYALLEENKSRNPNRKLLSILKKFVSKRFIETMIGEQLAHQSIGQMSRKTLLCIEQQLSRWRVTPSGTEGYRTAEVTIGGVDTNDLSQKNGESKHTKGLYFIGEAVDVTGWLGGYNFQWAWSSGWAAGQTV